MRRQILVARAGGPGIADRPVAGRHVVALAGERVFLQCHAHGIRLARAGHDIAGIAPETDVIPAQQRGGQQASRRGIALVPHRLDDLGGAVSQRLRQLQLRTAGQVGEEARQLGAVSGALELRADQGMQFLVIDDGERVVGQIRQRFATRRRYRDCLGRPSSRAPISPSVAARCVSSDESTSLRASGARSSGMPSSASPTIRERRLRCRHRS